MAEGGLNGQTINRLIGLMEKTGYPIRQVNGQRIYGPHPDFRDIVPPKGSEVFVGKLPRDIFEDNLVPLFLTAGTIYELRLMMDFNGFNRGYAFVTYLDNFAADRAVKLLDNYELRPGRNIGVCKSVDNCRLFVGGIPRELTRADIFSEFIQHTSGVKDVIVYAEPGDRIKNRGFAFIEYESHRAAAMARRELVPAKVDLWNTELKVDWAEPEPVVDPLVMQRYVKGNIITELKKYLKEIRQSDSVTVLYARNLSPDINEAGLMNLFSLSGHLRITKVKKIRDFAFIHFQTKFEAQLALSKINGVTVDNCIIEVTWAKPPECSVRRHPRCNVEGYKSYPRHPLNLSSSSSDSALNEELLSSAAFDFDTSKLLSSSTSSINNAVATTASKFLNTKYPKLFAALCQKKGWGEPVYDCVLLPRTPYVPMQYRCKLVVPGMKVFDTTFTIIESASTIDDAKNKAAYTMMAKLGLINMDDGKPFSSTLDALLSPTSLYDNALNGVNDTTNERNDGIVNGIRDGILNGLSRLSLNSVDDGQGDCGLFQSNSNDSFLPYDGPAPKYGAISKCRPAPGEGVRPRCVPPGFTPQESGSSLTNVAATLFYSDYPDPSRMFREILKAKASGEDATPYRPDF